LRYPGDENRRKLKRNAESRTLRTELEYSGVILENMAETCSILGN
jgi:hypothetical protein